MDGRFVEIYESFYGFVYAFCRRRVEQSRVEDVVAETFLVAWRRIDEIPDGEDALRWLYAVAYRVVGHQWRGSARQRKLGKKLAVIAVEAATPPDQFVVVSDEAARVLQAASRLKRSDRELLIMAIWDELSYADIASILNIKTSAVKQRVYEARKRLTKEYNRLEKRQISTPTAQKGGAM
jgi:RNA polymerase sigma factor (sigma-70 family)